MCKKKTQKFLQRGENARIAPIFFCVLPGVSLNNVCDYCNDPISSFWVLDGITESCIQRITN